MIGEIFQTKEADNLYGIAEQAFAIQTEIIKQLLNRSTKYLMFAIINNNIAILGDERKLLYPDDIKINDNDVFRIFSIPMVSELLSLGNESDTFVELRKDGVLSVTNGSFTMEIGQPCPPYCA